MPAVAPGWHFQASKIQSTLIEENRRMSSIPIESCGDLRVDGGL